MDNTLSNEHDVVFTLQNQGSYNLHIVLMNLTLVVFTLQNQGSYNCLKKYAGQPGCVYPAKSRQLQPTSTVIFLKQVVFTLQNQGSYNANRNTDTFTTVVFTLQNQGSYNDLS